MATFLIESSYDVEQIHLKLGIVSVNTFIAHLLSIVIVTNKHIFHRDLTTTVAWIVEQNKNT